MSESPPQYKEHSIPVEILDEIAARLVIYRVVQIKVYGRVCSLNQLIN